MRNRKPLAHTAGEWKVNPSDVGLRLVYVDVSVGVIKPIADVQINEETEANAALIVAAPKLLAALQRIANHETRADRRKRGVVDASEIADLQRIARLAVRRVRRLTTR